MFNQFIRDYHGTDDRVLEFKRAYVPVKGRCTANALDRRGYPHVQHVWTVYTAQGGK